MKLNKRLLPIKAHYFFQNGGSAPIAPFIPVIGKDLGFSATIVGLVMTTVPLLGLITKPILGGVADKLSAHKTIFICLIVVNLVFFFGIQWLPALPIDRTVAMACSSSGVTLSINTPRAADDCFVDRVIHEINSSLLCRTDQLYFDVMTFADDNGQQWDSPSCPAGSPRNLSCQLFCTVPFIQEVIRKPIISDSSVFGQAAFWLFAVFIIVPRVAASSVNSLGDSICFKLLGDRPNDYGYQRMWGAAGWGLIAFVTGVIVDKMSEGKFGKDYTAAYYLSAFLMLCDLIVASRLSCSVTVKPPSIFKNVKQVLTGNPRFLLYLVIIVFCGIFSALIWSFLFWFIEEVAGEDGCSDLSWVKTLDGLTLAVHCYLGEIPFFWVSGWMLKHIGHAHCMTIVLLAFSIRFVAFYFLTSAWWILPVETLNGVTFATFYSTMTTYANALTPPGMQGTIQGFVAAVFEVGIAIGSVTGGYIYDKWGGRAMYAAGGVVAASLAVIHTIIQLCCGEDSKKGVPLAELSVGLNSQNFESH
ncbi:unnamed protein product [Nesidiocoris tenuis]|uniref:Major facilitator superfamily (MFS) profile domain-containing protein n=1 Tax=Nesidiocoris tenuis TaxID=355587 RepID=A0A6H5GTH6_9HEMI|nr:unnamed protein product [Nesidiocoris tenuis]